MVMRSFKKFILAVELLIIIQKCCSETVITAQDIVDQNLGSEIIETTAVSDLDNHPCRRKCRDNMPPMECRYEFNVEAYYTMSKACFNCPMNLTDCFRPDCVPADGVKRPLVVVNRQMPGPSVEVCLGDRVIVDVHNLLPSESTTMHWHGQHHRSTPYMDGVPYVTQCPIQPGATFRYHYVAATAGTHFWHSHSGFQRGDGVFGAMIVRVPPSLDPLNEFYDYDEHTMILTDWEHDSGASKFVAHHHADGDNKPPNLLINGLGRYKKNSSDDTNGTDTPVAVFSVREGYRYRFRLINAEFLNCPIEVSIDNHTIHVISTDGNDIKPVPADSLVTYAGERFDFLVHMNQEKDNYWIRFRGLMDCDERFTSAYQVAVLRYEGAPEVEPVNEVSYFPEWPSSYQPLVVNALNEGTESNRSSSMPLLEALDPDDESNTKDPEYQFYISYDFYGKDNPHFHRKRLYGFDKVTDRKQKLFTPQLNYISMKLPDFPLLSQRESVNPRQFCNESTVSGCEEDYCACTHVLEVELGSVVELILVDKGFTYDANHPFHLHGHDFRVIAMERVGKNVTVDEIKKLDSDGLIKRKLSHAPIKDTVTVPDGGYTIVRFHANNPGYWLFHCHIEFHVELGMALIFKVGDHEDFPPVPKDFPRCGSYTPSGPPEDDNESAISEKTTTMTTTTTTTTTEKPSTTSTTTEDPRETELIIKEKIIITRWLPTIIEMLRNGNHPVSSSSIFKLPQILIIVNAILLITNIFGTNL